MNSGVFITIEGGEGVGKTTQIERLVRTLQNRQYDVVETHDPGGTTIGGRIRGIVTEKDHKELSAKTELLLFLAARAQLVSEVVIPSLEAGKIVISDRYYHSTYAYQGGARGIGMEQVKQLNEFTIEGIYPDITFLLDLPVKAGFNRMRPKEDEQVALSLHLPSNNKRINIDRIEREGDDFHDEVRSAFRALAAEEPDRIVVVDASLSISEVASQIESRVFQLLEQRSGQ